MEASKGVGFGSLCPFWASAMWWRGHVNENFFDDFYPTEKIDKPTDPDTHMESESDDSADTDQHPYLTKHNDIFQLNYTLSVLACAMNFHDGYAWGSRGGYGAGKELYTQQQDWLQVCNFPKLIELVLKHKFSKDMHLLSKRQLTKMVKELHCLLDSLEGSYKNVYVDKVPEHASCLIKRLETLPGIVFMAPTWSKSWSLVSDDMSLTNLPPPADSAATGDKNKKDGDKGKDGDKPKKEKKKKDKKRSIDGEKEDESPTKKRSEKKYVCFFFQNCESRVFCT